MSGPSAPDPVARREWSAFYLDGRTAARHPASVHVMPSGLKLEVAGVRTWWPYAQVRQTQGFYTGEEVRLERRGSSEAVVLPEPGFLAALHRVAPELGRRFHHPASRRRRVALTVGAGVLALVLTTAIYLWGIPAVAAVAAAYVPVSWEEQLGAAIVEQLAPAEKRCTGPQASRALETLMRTLTRTPGVAAPPTVGGYRLRVIVLNAPAVNAFAIPGGHIVLLRGLVERARTPEELAGVLAHEIQHVVRRHSTRALLQHASTAVLAAAVMGDVSGAMALGLESARTLVLLRYGRAHEEEADVEGYRMLVAAGIDPRGLIEFFRSLDRESGGGPRVPAYLSTHPMPVDRIARLEGLPRPSIASAPLLGEEEWHALKTVCGRDRP